jgi:NAD(P)-dependent dehydrogenase (short-subunit alcohol dehydrogenase family)
VIDYGIAGRVAVVTGGSRGVGRACALALAGQGVNVALVARRADVLAETEEEIRVKTGVDVLSVPTDMGSYDQIKRMVALTAERFGRIDILVNNAASFAFGSMLQLSDEDWVDHFTVKTFGYLRCMREVAPHMAEGGWGRIVNIAGTAARQSFIEFGGPGSAGATNAAIVNINKSFADAYAGDGVTANVVHPGASDSDREGLRVQWMSEERGVPEAEIERERAGLVAPLGRKVLCEDTAHLVLFLVSEQAAMITGQTVEVDGGRGRGIFY